MNNYRNVLIKLCTNFRFATEVYALIFYPVSSDGQLLIWNELTSEWHIFKDLHSVKQQWPFSGFRKQIYVVESSQDILANCSFSI
jgi:hypothetical protein